MEMKTIKTNKYAPLVLKLRNDFDARINAVREFRVDFRTFIHNVVPWSNFGEYYKYV
jgi:hypothetical protein